MTAFLVWIILISLGLSVYSIILWKRAKAGSRFQARLTILFFLFVLVPTVPLTLSVSVLLTKSTELFVLPDIEESLSESLQLMRTQLTQQCSKFLSDYAEPDSVNQQILNNEQISYFGEISQENTKYFITKFAFTNEINKSAETIPDNLDQYTTGQTFDALTRINGKEFYEFYKSTENGKFVFAGIELSESFIGTREKISWALRNYSSLSLLRDTFISQGLIWAIAVIFVILLTIIAIYTGKNISKGISEPIQQLTDGMIKVGSGDLSHRVTSKANDEIEFLINSFNKMTSELQENRDNLKKAERAAAWRDIARQISHEIKQSAYTHAVFSASYSPKNGTRKNFRIGHLRIIASNGRRN
jgi:two-component system, NtrC family, nitrogen regulation sensor histidine kinase NtrY